MLVSVLKSSGQLLSRRFFSSKSILPHELDRFNAALVRADAWSNDSEAIREQLSVSLQQWRKDERTAVWLWIPIEKAHLIPIAAQLGFTYHNAENRMAVLNQWLLPSKSLLPRFATHQVGVAGAVLRKETNELLVIKERVGNRQFWKLPGGASELSENIADGAIREVFEETGVRSKFESIIGFRQQHHFPGGHGRSDLYFVCRLTAITDVIHLDPIEILDCRWMKLIDVLELENPILRRVAEQLLFGLEHEEKGGGFEASIDFCLEHIPSIFSGIQFDFFARSIGKKTRKE